MLLEKIKTPGLSHLSYLVGSGGQAAVIDPRRDCAIYVEKARQQDLKLLIFLKHIVMRIWFLAHLSWLQ